MAAQAIIHQHAVEPFFKNGYIVGCADTAEAIYIDPGDEAPELLGRINQEELSLFAIVNTHAHLDHICGVQRVREAWDVPIYLHEEDEFLYRNLEKQAGWFGLQCSAAPPVDRHLEEGHQLQVGRLTFQVYHTPGHSPGSVSLEVDEHIFCGDLIFAGSIGRTDLPGGSLETLLSSIREKILPLGDEKILHPGHGPDTRVGEERRTNPYLTGSPLPRH